MRSRTPIKTNLCSRIRPDGGRDHYSYFSDNIFVKDNLTIKKIKSNEKYELVKPADNILRWVRLGLKDKNVQKALRLYGMGNLDWVNLYRLYEVIEDDLNRYSSKNVNQRGWATQNPLNDSNTLLIAQELSAMIQGMVKNIQNHQKPNEFK